MGHRNIFVLVLPVKQNRCSHWIYHPISWILPFGCRVLGFTLTTWEQMHVWRNSSSTMPENSTSSRHLDYWRKIQDFSSVEDKMHKMIPGSFSLFPPHLPCPSAPHTQCWLEIPVLQEQLEKHYEHDKIKNGFQLYVTRIPKNVSWNIHFISALFFLKVFLNRTDVFTYGFELPSKLSPKREYFNSYCWHKWSTQYS